MITHTNIWKAIDLLAAQKGLSPSALAKMAGLNVTTFNPSKRISPDGRKRWPSTESLALILKVTNTTLGGFSSLLETLNSSTSSELRKSERNSSKKEKTDTTFSMLNISNIEKFSCFTPQGLPTGKAWIQERKNALMYLNPSSSYALIIDTKTFEPVFSYESILVVSSSAPIAKKSYIFYLLKNTTKPIFGLVLNKSKSEIEILPLKENARKRVISLDKIKWLYRVVGQSL